MKMHDYQTAVSRNRGAAVLDTYLNPTIIEERKLNTVSMDVFSRLMMDRIIFSECRLMTMWQISSRHSCSSLHRLIRLLTYPSISILPEDR